MNKLIPLVLVVTLVAGCSNRKSSPKAQQQIRVPEDVAREFFLAILSNDEAGIRKEILPNPDAQILWEGERLSPRELSIIKKPFESMTCREFQVGEIIDLPGVVKVRVTDQLVNSGRKLLLPILEGRSMPTPLSVVMVDGVWKVDAGSLIVARKAAQRAREKEASNH